MFIIQIGGKTLWYHSVMEFATVDDAYLPNSFLFGQVRSQPVMQLELFKSCVWENFAEYKNTTAWHKVRWINSTSRKSHIIWQYAPPPAKHRHGRPDDGQPKLHNRHSSRSHRHALSPLSDHRHISLLQRCMERYDQRRPRVLGRKPKPQKMEQVERGRTSTSTQICGQTEQSLPRTASNGGESFPILWIGEEFRWQDIVLFANGRSQASHNIFPDTGALAAHLHIQIPSTVEQCAIKVVSEFDL